jgi:hypothetical protein
MSSVDGCTLLDCFAAVSELLEPSAHHGGPERTLEAYALDRDE